MEEIKIGIVDDHKLFRKGIANICNSFTNVSVVLEADNGKQLIEQLQNQKNIPDIILLDLNMPEMDGIETMKQLKKIQPSIKNIILSIYNEERIIFHLVECGARGYLFKNCELEELENSIRVVASKGFYFPGNIIELLQDYLQRAKNKMYASATFVDITDREKEILVLICEQYTAEEIGKKLFISKRTVEGHKNHLLLKSGCKNVAGLAIFAIKNRIYFPAL